METLLSILAVLLLAYSLILVTICAAALLVFMFIFLVELSKSSLL